MNNLAFKEFTEVNSLRSFGVDDGLENDISVESVRAAQYFVSHGSNNPQRDCTSFFVTRILVPDLARQLSMFRQALSYSLKPSAGALENLKAYSVSRSADKIKDELGAAQYVEMRELQKPLSKTYTASSGFKAKESFEANALPTDDMPENVAKKKPASLVKLARKNLPTLKPKQTHGETHAGFERISQLEQASFSDIDSGFSTLAFVASDRLVRIWVEGMNALRQETDAKLVTMPSDKTNRALHKELEREVDTIISNYARFKANDYGGQSFKLTFGGQFYAPFETLVSDYLILPPRTSVLFLDELKHLLVSQAQEGPKFRRRWGELLLDPTGDLLLRLKKLKSRKASDYF